MESKLGKLKSFVDSLELNRLDDNEQAILLGGCCYCSHGGTTNFLQCSCETSGGSGGSGGGYYANYLCVCY